MAAPSKQDDYADMLGMMPDAEIAEAAGVAASTVAEWRKTLDVAAYKTDADASAGRDDAGDAGDASHSDDAGADADFEPSAPKPSAPKRAAAPKKPQAPNCVRATKNTRCKGPDGRTMRVDFRGVYRGERAAWLWEHHRNLVEPFPPKG